MTPAQFRRVALSMPDGVEGAHGGHPDFRVGGKVFARLGAPDAGFGMVKLTPDQQAMLTQTMADTLLPVRGAWGSKGYTNVRLANINAAALNPVLALAHANCASNKKRPAPAPKKRMAGLESPAISKASKRVKKVRA